MKAILSSILFSVAIFTSSAQAAGVADQVMLVCTDISGEEYGVALTLYETNESLAWSGSVFNQEQKQAVLDGASFFDLEIVSGDAQYSKGYPSLIMTLEDGSTRNLDCRKLSVINYFESWYKVLSAYIS